MPILFLLACFALICGTFTVCYGISLLRNRSLHQNVSTTSTHHNIWQPIDSVHCNSSLYDREASVYRHDEPSAPFDGLETSANPSHSGVTIDPPPRSRRLLSYKSTDDNVPPPSYSEATGYAALETADMPSPNFNCSPSSSSFSPSS